MEGEPRVDSDANEEYKVKLFLASKNRFGLIDSPSLNSDHPSPNIKSINKDINKRNEDNKRQHNTINRKPNNSNNII